MLSDLGKKNHEVKSFEITGKIKISNSCQNLAILHFLIIKIFRLTLFIVRLETNISA